MHGAEEACINQNPKGGKKGPKNEYERAMTNEMFCCLNG